MTIVRHFLRLRVIAAALHSEGRKLRTLADFGNYLFSYITSDQYNHKRSIVVYGHSKSSDFCYDLLTAARHKEGCSEKRIFVSTQHNNC